MENLALESELILYNTRQKFEIKLGGIDLPKMSMS